MRYNTYYNTVGFWQDAWHPYESIFHYFNNGFFKLPDIYFRLRDKTTGKVGNLSKSKISGMTDRSARIPFKWMVI